MSARRWAAALTVGSLALTGCAQTRPTQLEPSLTTASPGPSDGPTLDLSDQDCAAAATKLTVQQQAGEVVLIGLAHAPDAATTALLTKTHAGGVVLTGTFRTGIGAISAITKPLTDAGLLVAVAQEGGAHQPLSGPGFDAIPAPADQGVLPPDKAQTSWQTWYGQLADAGVNLNLAPSGDLALGATENPRLLGKDVNTVADLLDGILAGADNTGVAVAVTHYPGMGALPAGPDATDAGPATDTTVAPADESQATYRMASGSGADAIGVSTATFTKIDPASPAVYSAAVMAMAREDLRFDGVLLSDDLAAKSLAAVPASERVWRFIKVGGELAVVSDPSVAEAAIGGLAAAAASDPDLAKRLATATANVLALKSKVGLSDCIAVRG
ncbi:MAG TPA: glycoside hydrolase family 3 N-terminal domain-containing protein [Propioniciclava tarda]|nr:glycoside hydrolase family 3 N-terminal domain-containing protein [Propioniciclava tarda]HQA30419.1 glycoside hydrolase family 3 N-terminal domain-containing protein [Propioniciclava tarda]